MRVDLARREGAEERWETVKALIVYVGSRLLTNATVYRRGP